MDHRKFTSLRGTQPVQGESRRTLLSRSLRSITTVTATVVLIFGGSILSVSTAHAAPGDPVTFADPGLSDAVNVALGQSAGDPITEAQAAGLTELYANDRGVTNLSGIEYLTGLEILDLNRNNVTNLAPLAALSNLQELRLYENGITDASALAVMTNLGYLYLDDNNITDLAPFVSMTGLAELSLTGNGITDISQLANVSWLTGIYVDDNNISDISPLATMTGLESVVLYNNQISDLSPLSALTQLKGVHMSGNYVSDLSPLSGLSVLQGLSAEDNLITDLSPLVGISTLEAITAARNSITDISPLSSMPGLAYVTVNDQNVTMPVAAPGLSTANPVVDRGGNPVAVSSAEHGFTFDAVANTWNFTGSGMKTLAWNTTVDVGEYVGIPFTGTILQEISPLVTLQDPVVTQAACADGKVTGPLITLPTTEGIIYTLVGDVVPGGTVTIHAAAVEGRVLVPAPDSSWSTDSDGMTGILTVTLTTVECDAPPAEPNDEDPKPVNSDSEPLAKTGAANSAVMFGGLGALLALAGMTLMAVRSRNATR